MQESRLHSRLRYNEIKAKELPELDDEFAQDAAGVDTLAEYKEEIQKEPTTEEERRTED